MGRFYRREWRKTPKAYFHQAPTASLPPRLLARPAGIAELDGKRVDVVTAGEMIGANEAVQVIQVERNRAVVERAEDRV